MALSSAADAYQRQALIAAAAVQQLNRLRSSLDLTRAAQIITAYQLVAAQEAASGVTAMAAQQGLSTTAEAGIALGLLAGVASSGTPLLDTLQSVKGAANLLRFGQTMVQDAGRQGGFLAAATRPSITGYTRMLQPPSCSRCIVLAGKFYPTRSGVRFEEVPGQPGRFVKERQDELAFQRHPRCDCIQIPTSEDVAGDVTTDPRAAFESMSGQEQDDAFGVAGAQAIRDGADISQVVNARQGMQPAQDIFGQRVLTTLSGTTSRGAFGRMNAQRAVPLPYRLMPETIYAWAKNHDDAMRLLRLYGYVL